MIEVRCDNCGRILEIFNRDVTWGIIRETANECHCPRCHPENFTKEEKKNEQSE